MKIAEARERLQTFVGLLASGKASVATVMATADAYALAAFDFATQTENGNCIECGLRRPHRSWCWVGMKRAHIEARKEAD